MKRQYEEPVVEVEWVEDVIIASGDGIHENELEPDMFGR